MTRFVACVILAIMVDQVACYRCRMCEMCSYQDGPAGWWKKICDCREFDQCMQCPGGHYCPGDGLYHPCGSCSGYQTSACTSSANVQCCGTSQADTWCIPDNSFLDGMSIFPCSNCGPGFTEKTACLRSQDRICSACGPGNFTALSNSICMPCVAECNVGYYESTRCTTSTNRVCSLCPANSYCRGGNLSMLPCISPCASGTYETTPCNPTDRVCTPCPGESFCVGGTATQCIPPCAPWFYESTPCTGVTDRVCLPVKIYKVNWTEPGPFGDGVEIGYPSYKNQKYINLTLKGASTTLKNGAIFRIPPISKINTRILAVEFSTTQAAGLCQIGYDANENGLIDQLMERGPGIFVNASLAGPVRAGSVAAYTLATGSSTIWTKYRLAIDLQLGTMNLHYRGAASWVPISMQVMANLDFAATDARNPQNWNAFAMEAQADGLVVEGLQMFTSIGVSALFTLNLESFSVGTFTPDASKGYSTTCTDGSSSRMAIAYPSIQNTHYLSVGEARANQQNIITFKNGTANLFNPPTITRDTAYVMYQWNTEPPQGTSSFFITYDGNGNNVYDNNAAEQGPGFTGTKTHNYIYAYGAGDRWHVAYTMDYHMYTSYYVITWRRFAMLIDIVQNKMHIYYKDLAPYPTGWVYMSAISGYSPYLDFSATNAKNPLLWNSFTVLSGDDRTTLDNLEVSSGNIGTTLDGNLMPSPCVAGSYCPNIFTTVACPVGTFNPIIGAASGCHTCAVCSNGSTYLKSACTLTSDTECLACTVCEPGQAYVNTSCNLTADTRCTACVIFGTPLCYCKPGYELVNTTCRICPAGTYCAGGNLSTCPNNTNSAVGSSKITACVCVPGFYGLHSNCTRCQANHYCTGGVVRTACVNNSISPAQSTSSIACNCSSGYAGVNNSNCKLCDPGTFCMNGIMGICPLHMSSPSMSSSVANCTCMPGFSGDACDACPDGTFKPTNGSDACTACPVEAYCPRESVNYTKCVAPCSPGFFENVSCTGASNRVCLFCPVDSFCTGGVAKQLCSPPCAQGSYKTANCIRKSDQVCSSCPANMYCPGGSSSVACTSACLKGTYETIPCTNVTNRFCAACIANSFCTWGAFISQCTSECPPGTYETAPCTASADKVCTKCPGDSFCTGGTFIKQCTPPCASDEYETSNCTDRVDRACSPCERESYCEGGVSMHPCTPECAPGTYETTPCTTATNRVCSICPAETYCLGGTQTAQCTPACADGTFESSPCTQTSDRICSECPPNTYCMGKQGRCTPECASGYYETTQCTKTTDRVCATCPVETFCANGIRSTPCTPKCAPGQYESTPCTNTSNRICSACPPGSYCVGGAHTCTPPCVTGTYETVACTATTDRVCTGCPSEKYCVGLMRECTPKCAPGTYESSPCTNATNRVCMPCPPNSYCVAGAVVACTSPCAMLETTPCTATTDRQCRPCPDSSYCQHGNATQCSKCQECELHPCNATSDSVCGVCPNVVRESLAIANLTLRACACSSDAITRSLSTLYDTRLLPVSCSSGGSTIVCENFTCPCAAARRLLSVETTQLSFVYQAARRDVSIENVTQAVQEVVPDAQVQDKTTETLPTNDMTWSDNIVVSGPDTVIGLVVAAVIVVLMALAAGYFICKMKKKKPKTEPVHSNAKQPAMWKFLTDNKRRTVYI